MVGDYSGRDAFRMDHEPGLGAIGWRARILPRGGIDPNGELCSRLAVLHCRRYQFGVAAAC